MSRDIHDKLAREANEKGLLLVGFSDMGGAYRLYQFKRCSHTLDIPTGSVRKHQPVCKQCQEYKLLSHLKSCGITKTQNGIYCVDLCGHVVDIKHPARLHGKFECRECLTQLNKEVAESKGLQMVGDSDRGSLYKRYKVVSCGHHVDLQKSNVRFGKFTCSICSEEKLSREANVLGLSLIGCSDKGACYRKYLFPCGHSSSLKTEKVRDGLVNCLVCGGTSWTKPSNTYVFKLMDGETQWLKVGYARSVNYRKTRYGLPDSVQIELLLVRKHETGKEASEREDEIFNAIQRWRLPAEKMKQYMALSGSTECFDVAALTTLEKFF